MKRITHSEDVALIILKNCPSDAAFFAKVLSEIGNAGIDIDMISQTSPAGGKIDIFFTVDDSAVSDILPITLLLKKEYPSVITAVNGNNCKISVYDDAMKSTPGYASAVFEKIASVGAELRLVTTSEVDISLLVVNSYLEPLLKIL